MFAYEHGRKPREWAVMLVMGVLYLLATSSPQIAASLWGVRAGLFLPGFVLLLVSGVLFFRATRLRDRYLTSRGVVVSVHPNARIPKILQNEAIPGVDFPMGGKTTRQRALRGERDEIQRGMVTIRFAPVSGDPIFIEVSGSFSYRVGDEVMMLYVPQEPESALPAEVVRLTIFSEAFNYGIMAVLYFGLALFFYWLFN